MKLILGPKRHNYLSIVGIFLLAATLIAGIVGCGRNPSEGLEIRTWYGLNAIRDNLSGEYTLMNDLDSTTAGYDELANPTANDGKGWQAIGTEDYPFKGTLDGQGYEIRDLFINRPGENLVGLFSTVDEGGLIENVSVVNADVTGDLGVGGLVGYSNGTVSDSYFTGSVDGDHLVGGLVGSIGSSGTASSSHSICNVTGTGSVGGLVGSIGSNGTVSDSYFTGSVNGDVVIGGLVGHSHGTVNNCYSTGSVTGNMEVGGLVGFIFAGTVSNSYSTGTVNGDYLVGGLVGWDSTPEKDAVTDSFWDTQTTGQSASAGGAGKNTTEMHNIATFSGATWDITAVVNPGTRNPSYIWNIVDAVTYPFLSWQP